MQRLAAVALVGVGLGAAVVGAGGCGDDGGASTAPVSFGTMKPLVGDAGKGGWRFGAASASAQIEDMNVNTDWWAYTSPESLGGLGKHTFVGAATKAYPPVHDDL